MSKEVFMQTRVEPELRASFYAAAASEHRPASQVMRQLMRDYVAVRIAAGMPEQEQPDEVLGHVGYGQIGQMAHSEAQQDKAQR